MMVVHSGKGEANLLCMHSVADHLVQSFIRFAGASYGWYFNICSGTVGDR